MLLRKKGLLKNSRAAFPGVFFCTERPYPDSKTILASVDYTDLPIEDCFIDEKGQKFHFYASEAPNHEAFTAYTTPIALKFRIGQYLSYFDSINHEKEYECLVDPHEFRFTKYLLVLLNPKIVPKSFIVSHILTKMKEKTFVPLCPLLISSALLCFGFHLFLFLVISSSILIDFCSKNSSSS